MSSPILSQGEIDALLHESNPHSQAEDLVHIFQLAAQAMSTWVDGVTLEPLEIEGPYVERLDKSRNQSVTEEALVVAADLGKSEILMIMSSVDAGYLAAKFQREPLKTMQMLSQAWVAEIAALVRTPYRVFETQKVGLGSLRRLPAQSKAYLVRHMLQRHSQRLEVCLIIRDGEAFEALAKQAMEQVNLEQLEAVSRGRPLKGSKSPVTRAVFTPIDQLVQLEDEQGMNLLEDIDLTVTVELGQTTLTLNELLELQLQSVIRLERHAGEPVDVFINATRAAKAEVVVLEDKFGVRILEIVPKSQRTQGE